jgi:hypothetical protein
MESGKQESRSEWPVSKPHCGIEEVEKHALTKV